MAPTGFVSRTHGESPLLDQLPISSSSPRSFRSSTHRSRFKGLPLPTFVRERPLRVAFLVLLALVLSFLGVVSWAHLNPDTRLGREMQFFVPAEEWRKGRVAFEKVQLRPLLGEKLQGGMPARGKEKSGAGDEAQRHPEQRVLGLAQESNASKTEAHLGNTAASAVIEQGMSNMAARLEIERGGANSSGTNPPDPHPVVAFVIKALSQLGIQKEPTLEAALLLDSPPKLPGSYSQSQEDGNVMRGNALVRQSLEHSNDVEISQELDPKSAFPAEESQSEDPVLNQEMRAPKSMRKGTPTEQLRSVMPERRPNPIPNPEFWVKAYYNSGSSNTCDLGDGAWIEDAELEPLGTRHCR